MSGSLRDTASKTKPSFVRPWLKRLRLALQGHLMGQNTPPATGKPDWPISCLSGQGLAESKITTFLSEPVQGHSSGIQERR